MDSLFTIFTMTDNYKATKQRGTGIGLYMCKYLSSYLTIEEGGIKVESEVGKGSKFSFILKD